MIPALIWIWPETPITLAVILVGAIVVHWILHRAIRGVVAASVTRAQRKHEGLGRHASRILSAAAGFNSARHEARTRTMGSVLQSIVTVAVWAVSVLTIMASLGLPLAPLLASAGIGGVAIGFGAQSLVKDYLSGIFMIMEDQYGVGDLINTGEVSGVVEEVGLRVTKLRDPGGQVWYVRNGEILRVGNQTQGWSTGSIDVPVAYNEDAGRVIEILNDVCAQVFADEKWTDVLLEQPTVAGVDKVAGGTMTVRIFAKCAPNEHWGVQRDILERSIAALHQAGVRGPVLLPNVPHS